ncbi:MAG: ATP-dependent 6-phosphofructokinase [Candidatus Eisenbacteria bacterium]|nr:ATP-dependent 6-phosphofructokinase [Candidatus Eisenbacteria bacterium]
MKKTAQPKKRIAVLTGGGDCPGINAVIRAVTKKAIVAYGMEVIGIEDGYEGIIHGWHRKLTYEDVSGILTLGGTILGASKTANPYKYAVKRKGKLEFEDVSRVAIDNLQKLDVAGLVCIGGDGTLGIARDLCEDGVRVVGVPKTIDNDIRGTDVCFGFDSAVWVATEGIDRIHTTAQSHHRIMIVEVMGHKAGWIALHSGVAGGGDIILIPEIPYDVEKIALKIQERHHRRRSFTIVVVAEGARPKGGDVVIQRMVKESADPVRLGGVGFVLGEKLERLTGFETRTTVMGHVQRGGSPTPFDRVLATELGARAVDMIEEKAFGHMVGVKGNALVDVPLGVVTGGPRVVPRNQRLLEAARALGTYFGD